MRIMPCNVHEFSQGYAVERILMYDVETSSYLHYSGDMRVTASRTLSKSSADPMSFSKLTNGPPIYAVRNANFLSLDLCNILAFSAPK